MEYHFNSAGYNDPHEYLAQFGQFAYQQGGVFLLGKHYLIPGLSWSVTPLINAKVEWIWNASDLSSLLSPSVEYNIEEDLYLDLGVYVATGQKTNFSPANLTSLQLESEFGLYSSFIYAAVRYYF